MNAFDIFRSDKFTLLSDKRNLTKGQPQDPPQYFHQNNPAVESEGLSYNLCGGLILIDGQQPSQPSR